MAFQHRNRAPLLVIGLIAMACACDSQRRDDTELPVVSIDIVTSGGAWHLRIDEDGSGRLGYGSSGDESRTFAAGTIDLNGLYVALEPLLTNEIVDDTRETVAIHREGAGWTTHYVPDTPIVVEAFQSAAATIDDARLQELWRDQNPFRAAP